MNTKIKSLNYFGIVLLLAVLSFFKPVQAQVNVTVNIGSQPLWGPVGYDYVEYYYLPEPEVYYYVPTRQFVYLNGGNWLFVSSLPAIYHVDLFHTYKVVVNRPKAYLYHSDYKVKYAKYKKVKTKQVIIRDSRDKKYYVVKGHPGNGGGKKVSPSGRSGNPGKAAPAKSGGNPGKAAPSKSGNPGKGNSGGKSKGGGGKKKGG